MLLVKRGKAPSRGRPGPFPAEASRLGETLRQAAEREVLEETGVRHPRRRAGAHLRDDRDRTRTDAVRFHYVIVDLAGRATWTGTRRPASDAADAPLGVARRSCGGLKRQPQDARAAAAIGSASGRDRESRSRALPRVQVRSRRGGSAGGPPGVSLDAIGSLAPRPTARMRLAG
ncbi:MAG: NUDIX domain-containing protein [Desulfobacterales bacterium]|nr:NUDIX domain-containing protein [Desulfobacterales bacterium]